MPLTSRAVRNGLIKDAADLFTRRNMWLAIFGTLHGTFFGTGNSAAVQRKCVVVSLSMPPDEAPNLISGWHSYMNAVGHGRFVSRPERKAIDLGEKNKVIVQKARTGQPLANEERGNSIGNTSQPNTELKFP